MPKVKLKGPPWKMQVIGRHPSGQSVGATVATNTTPGGNELVSWRIPRNVPTSVPEQVADVLRNGHFDFEEVS